jgi:hypothetical protein
MVFNIFKGSVPQVALLLVRGDVLVLSRLL